MLKRVLLTLSLIFVFLFQTFANPQDKSQEPPNNPSNNSPLDKFVKLDDIAILRLLYSKETLTYKSVDPESNEPLEEQHYQVGEGENHKISVLSRTLGKFTQAENQELLAMISIENSSNTPYKSGIYALLLRIGDSGVAELIARSSNLYRLVSSDKIWRSALITDINFDKQDDLVMQEGEKKGVTAYSLYTWDSSSKDFTLVSNHPAQALLSYYASLNAAAILGLEGEQAPGNNQLTAAYEKLSPKMQGLQSTDVVRRRLKDVKRVELNSLKLLIKSDISALVRIQYRLVDNDGFKQTFEGDYQIKRNNQEWQLDSERLKSVNLAK
ncbi:MAG: hypothetical protein HY819_22090 [Acidobacteria bacterium]|nr:hypothetical protein [Acidobacteriota bacterium]